MKTVYYPSFGGHRAYSAYYDIVNGRDPDNPSTEIVVIHSPTLGPLISLTQFDGSRDVVLNKILSTDLQGVPVSFVRFCVIIDSTQDPGRLLGHEYEILLDFDDYKKKGNPCSGPSLWERILQWPTPPRYTWLTRDVVGGCARFFTREEESKRIPQHEIHQLCAAVGYQHQRTGLPHWLTQKFSNNPPNPDLSLT